MPFVDLSNNSATQSPSGPQDPNLTAQVPDPNALPPLDSAPTQLADQQVPGVVSDPMLQTPAPQPIPSQVSDPIAVTSPLPADPMTVPAEQMPAIEQMPTVDQLPMETPQSTVMDMGANTPAVPEPETVAPAGEETETPDTNKFVPVGELNSLNIPDTDNTSTAKSNSDVEIQIDEQGVKTMNGPSMPTPVASTEAVDPVAPTDSVAPDAGVVTDTPIDTTAAPVAAMPEPDSTGGAISEAQPAADVKVSAATEGEKDLLPSNTDIEVLMALAREKDASDIHIAANYPVMLRLHGQLTPVTQTLSPEEATALVHTLLNEDQKKVYEKEREIDFSFTSAEKVRFRVNVFTERNNPAAALRLIATKIRTVVELDLPEVLIDLTSEPHGLVLVVGPTGSGKSTTLAAMLNHINLTRREHILTIEDPIEYVYPVGKSIVDQREIGADTNSFGRALKSALREDPNVVLVGEMRDLDTISSTITIAETGHLVFATLHTNSASQAIDRIIDVFPEGAKNQIRAQLANVITAVVSQRLIPVNTGGRRAALEVMLGTVAVRNAVREGKTYQIDNIIQTSGDLGMMTMEKSLVQMVKNGYITKEEAKQNSVKPDEIESLLAQI